MKAHNKLTEGDRDQIALLKAQGCGIRKIARQLQRSPSTISEELTRNRFGNHYVAIHAQALTEERKKQAHKRHPLKNPSVYKYTLKKLRNGWSPEQIAGRLKLRKPDNPYWHICHETIYQFIYNPDNQAKYLWEYLPRKQKKRKKQKGRKVHRNRIPDRVSIHYRPEEANNRSQFGHWEGDSVIGRKTKNIAIQTEVERKTRFFKARLKASLSAKDTLKAQQNIFSSLPEKARKSTTLDNGKEFVKHARLRNMGMDTYHADPYSSWQRGSNEYHNGLLRRYLPKRTDFSTITQTELNDIVKEINNRPRKCLGFYTPKEAFEKELKISQCSDST